MKNNYWAKIYRTLTSVFPVAKNRKGACRHCGACCRLPNKCYFLRFDKNGKSRCAIWKTRPLNCRKYPRTEKEWLTKGVCGYRFER